MKYFSVCSGIEAATVAWKPLGWEAVGFSEIEKFPRAVLERRHPNVPLHGDFTEIGKVDDFDLLVGGTPCQSFSIAGLHKGMDDDRGNLSLEFMRLAKNSRPRWVVWENVPGVLSSDGGRAFGSILGALEECGYGWAYRTLDAQYFGVPQRRRRVFVVGYLGDWRRAAAVLLERESLHRHPPPSREARQSVAHDPAPCLTNSGRGTARIGETRGQDPVVAVSHDPAMTLTAREYKGPLPEADLSTVVAHSLRGRGFDASEDGTGRGTPLIPVPATQAVAFDMRGRDGGAMPEGPHDTANIRAASGVSSRSYVAEQWAVRRLTPVECERLQGFPDDYTRIEWRGKPADQCPDGPRYKALGNSMAVPCMKWIGKRIKKVETL